MINAIARTKNILKHSKGHRIILFCTIPSLIQPLLCQIMKAMEEPCISEKTETQIIEATNWKSMNNDHHKKPFYYCIPELPTSFYLIILVSV